MCPVVAGGAWSGRPMGGDWAVRMRFPIVLVRTSKLL